MKKESKAIMELKLITIVLGISSSFLPFPLSTLLLISIPWIVKMKLENHGLIDDWKSEVEEKFREMKQSVLELQIENREIKKKNEELKDVEEKFWKLSSSVIKLKLENEDVKLKVEKGCRKLEQLLVKMQTENKELREQLGKLKDKAVNNTEEAVKAIHKAIIRVREKQNNPQKEMEVVKLHETENAWKPQCINANVLPDEQAKTEQLYRKLRGILNRLTPQKIHTLLLQVVKLPIDNCEVLQGVVKLVLDKAINEPLFCVGYAQVCKVLSYWQVPVEGKDENSPVEYIHFRKLILNGCQQEFEKITEAKLNKEIRLKEIDNCKDPETKKELQLQFEEESRNVQMRSVGSIKFISELFKLQMLTTNIMHKCIQQLISHGEEESLECLCTLLTTTGKDLEVKMHQDLSSYFEKMKIISLEHSEISSRVKFMLQDVIELRQNKWVPKKNECNS